MNFSSKGKNYTATIEDIFMNNGATIVYIKRGKFASQVAQRVLISDKEWQRIKPLLCEIDYEQYYGRKPLVNVTIYTVKS